jgi:5'-methylthioadenosine phosphorylase
MQTLGIIGGSGLYELPGLTSVREVKVRTPFGEASDAYILGELSGVKLAFLPRHGRGHRHLPTEINSRANLWGFRKLGAERVISFSAVGSMREDVAPGDIVVIDQFIDRTTTRPQSFFGDGLVGHVSFADPVCQNLAGALHDSAVAAGARTHKGGTYLCIEGPAFSTRAESRLYRQWNVDVIGMTNVTEAKLAREAELCYATVALATDYDCWHQSEEEVSVAAVIAVLKRNVTTAHAIIREAARRLSSARTCSCGETLRHALMTAPEAIPASTRRRLDLLIAKYLPQAAGRTGARKPRRAFKVAR